MIPELSIIIPVYNEKESLKELLLTLKDSLKRIRKSYEILFIDDGSNDGSFELLKILENKKDQVKIYSFRKNLGKSYAFMLGFQKARGKYIVTLDADLQDDPKNIKLLYDKLHQNEYDMVTGWRKNRKDNTFKKLFSRIFNKVVSWLFNIKINDLNSGLKIYKNYVAKDLKLYGGMHRFIPLLVNEMGYKIGEKEISHHARKYGESKYKITKVITDIPDLITIYFLTKYTRRPLHFFGKIGALAFMLGFVILFYLTILRFQGERIGTRPLLFLGVLLLITGLQVIFTGLLADLLVNTNSKEENEFPLKYGSTK